MDLSHNFINKTDKKGYAQGSIEMSYLLEEDLTSQGIATKTTLKIRFNDKVYVRVKTLPKKFYEQAKKLKEEYKAQNLDSLLIEHKTWIAVWKEELSQLDEIDYSYQEEEVLSSLANTTYQLTKIQGVCYLDDDESLNLPEFSSQLATRKYRGVVYEDNHLEDNHLKESSAIVPAHPKARKYRGVVYEDTYAVKPTARKYRGRLDK